MLTNEDIILVTGGTGKTGSQVAKRSVALGRRVRVASRTGSASIAGAKAVTFDWTDTANHADILDGVGAVYMVAPAMQIDPFDVMRRFVTLGLTKGVRRYVLLSASSIPEGGPAMGRVHHFLRETVSEWAVLRPSWFMQNFSQGNHLPTIRDEGLIYSACEDGKVPFVDVMDIAEVAVRALTDPEPHNSDQLITGPRAISYDTAAEILSEAMGRHVRHHRLSRDELTDRWVASGLGREYGAMLADMDAAIADGAEDRTSDTVGLLTGRPAGSFEAFVQKNRDVWR